MDIISIRVWRMLPCGNIRHTLKQFGIALKQVYSKYFADAEQLLGVNGGLNVKPLEGAAVDVQLVGEPLVGVVLATQFVADKVAYVYLHSGCCLCVWLPFIIIHACMLTIEPHINFVDQRHGKDGLQIWRIWTFLGPCELLPLAE